jgi:hypothetical protein
VRLVSASNRKQIRPVLNFFRKVNHDLRRRPLQYAHAGRLAEDHLLARAEILSAQRDRFFVVVHARTQDQDLLPVVPLVVSTILVLVICTVA